MADVCQEVEDGVNHPPPSRPYRKPGLEAHARCPGENVQKGDSLVKSSEKGSFEICPPGANVANCHTMKGGEKQKSKGSARGEGGARAHFPVGGRVRPAGKLPVGGKDVGTVP